MDPVTKVLVDRERTRRSMLPWVFLAIMMHAGLAAATFLVGRRAAARPVQLPVVAVKLVRPEAPQRSAPSRASRRSTPAPQPTQPPSTPVPHPTAPPTEPPKVDEPETDAPEASADAMRSADSQATPAPTAPPPEPVAGGAGGSGLSVGASAGGGTAGIPSDFHFTYYVERMLALIESRWYKPAVSAGTRARVGFVIDTSGRLSEIRLEESSGVASFDRAALRAIYAANPLPPLPPAYKKPNLRVHLSFSE
jgi:protein TonB